MVGPEYQRPDASVNPAWLGPSNTTPEAAAAQARWWHSFDDPTLTRLVESAYQQNLELRAAGLRVLEARAARGLAVGQFFPQFQEANGTIRNNQLSANDGPTAGDRSFASASLGLEAAWELDFWGKFRRGIEAADAEVLLTVAQYDDVLTTLVADVATNYVLIRSLEERLEYARANANLQDETLKLTTTRFKVGAVSELDVSTARATLANTRARIPDLENSLLQTKMALCVLLGRTPATLNAELATTSTTGSRVPAPPAVLATGLPADLLRRRPDVRAAERAAAAQSARIGQAVADLFPRLSIVGATGFVSSSFEAGQQTSLGNIFNADSFAGFIGLQMNWPVLNYGRIENNIRIQDAQYERAVALYQNSVLRAASEVESSLSEFLRARERTELLSESVEASRRSVDLSLIQYRAGAVDFIRVNDAQTVLVQAQDNLVVARAAIATGAIRTYRAVGGGWEIRRGNEFIDPATAERMRARTDWGDVLAPGWEQRGDLLFDRRRAAEPGAQP